MEEEEAERESPLKRERESFKNKDNIKYLLTRLHYEQLFG